MIAFREDGTPLELTQEIGKGAEGTVYQAAGIAAKVWNKETRNDTISRKLTIMIRDTPDLIPGQGSPKPQNPEKPQAAWPSEMLLDQDGNKIGFTMPILCTQSHRSVFQYFNPEARKRLAQKPDRKDLIVIARNLADAARTIHQAGHVIGDVCEKNVMVGNDLAVTLVDTDSMQVRDHRKGEIFRCTKGRDDYTPPRLQGLPFRDHDRTPDDDAFGLAVLIFKITMNGVHPFSSTADPEQERNTTLADKIRQEYFPYNESGTTPTEHQPSRPYREAWINAPFSLRHLFRRAFDPDATRSGPRPTPEEWGQELNHLVTTPEEKPRNLPPENNARNQNSRTQNIRNPRGSRQPAQTTPATAPEKVTIREIILGTGAFILVLAGTLSFHGACGPGF